MQITVVQKQKYSQSARGLQRKERYSWPRELGRLWAVSERMGRICAGRVELRTAQAKAQSGKGIARSPVRLVCQGNAGNPVTRGWVLSRGLWMPGWGVGLDWSERRGDLVPVQSLTQTMAALGAERIGSYRSKILRPVFILVPPTSLPWAAGLRLELILLSL